MYVRMARVMMFRAYFVSVYCNSLLATLNVRDSIRERGHASLGISLNPIDMSNSSSAANRKVVWSMCPLFSTVAHSIFGSGNRHQGLDRRCRSRSPRICQIPRWEWSLAIRSLHDSHRHLSGGLDRVRARIRTGVVLNASPGAY